MDQRVSPRETVWLAGSCPWAAAAACVVSCCVVSRCCVVSCAGRTRHISGNAARASSTARSERQIVVLLIQRLRERVERFWGFAAGLRGPLRSSSRSRAYRGGSASRPQHDQLTRDDLGDVARLLVVVFPGPILDPSLDEDFVALFQVLLAHVGQAGSALVIPADNSMPVRLFLLLPAISRPLPAGSQGERGHTGTVIRAAHLGIGPQIPDELDLIETAAHNNLRTM